MNMNTITQELNKKIKMMSKEDFEKFVSELIRIYEKQHDHRDSKFILSVTNPQK